MATLVAPAHAPDSTRTALKTDSDSELAQAQKELEILKAADPFKVLEMAIEVGVERTRTQEALKARDAAVQRLVDAHESLRQKSAALEALQQKSRAGTPSLADSAPTIERIEMARMKDEIARLERTIVELRIEIRTLKENTAKSTEHEKTLLDFTSPASDEPADMVAARNAILAGLVLPDEVPDDMLSPLSIPPPLTLQEFISNLSGSLRTSLAHYRLFYATTTQWCPEREEHGYFYAPVFKCNTNPRVATAHRWNVVDVISRMNKPTECFFNKDGIWYYAGVYKAFRLADLSTKEWAELPIESTQAIVKETIAARKNTSPQNVYEITQLYAAGALKTACVGLQCVGFNNAMYKALLEQARLFAQSKWAASAAAVASVGSATMVPPAVVPGDALGSGSTWNTAAGVKAAGEAGEAAGVGCVPGLASNPTPTLASVVAGGMKATTGAGGGDISAGLAAMSLGSRSQNEHRNANAKENTPLPIGEGRKR